MPWGYQSHEARAEAASGLPASVPIRDLRRIRLAPDDALAVLIPEHVSRDEVARIRAEARGIFGSDREIIVVAGGAEIAAVTRG